jgi:hypothetical protein
VNLDALNRYVLIAIGVFAALLFAAIVCAGFGELISGLPKHSDRRKRLKRRRSFRRLRG